MKASEHRIARLTARAVNIPMAEPHQTASGTVSSSPLVLVDVLTDQGARGHAMVFTYTPAALKPLTEFVNNLAVLLEGSQLAPQEIEQQLRRKFRLLGTQGLVGMALSGIDMALWDALTRTAGNSLAAYLGFHEKPIRAYGAIGYDGPTGSAAVAHRWADKGFTAVKAKIGYESVAKDLEVIRAIRSAVGDGVDIMVDYNQALTVAEALERCRALDDAGVTWIEEPVYAQDFEGHARVAQATKTAIQAGENWWGPHELLQAVQAGASDHLMPDVMKIGGVSGWLRVAAIAETHSLKVSNHLFPEISAQLLCATPTAHLLEYADWWNPVLRQPLRIDGGFAHPEGALGTGVEWDEQAVQRFLVA